MSGSQRSRLNSIYWWLKDHWWASVLVTTIPAIIITIVEILGLTTSAGTINPWAVGAVITAVIVIIGYSVVKERADSQVHKNTIVGQQYLEIILEGVNNAQTRKKDRFVQYIERYKNTERRPPFGEITQPRIQLGEIVRELQAVISSLSDTNPRQVGVSIIGKTNPDGTWDFLAGENVGTKTHILRYLDDPTSGFTHLLTTDRDILFIPDKAKALLDREYATGARDGLYKHVGSLVCKRIKVGEYVTAVLSISTYGKYLYTEINRQVSETKIENHILPPFITRIELELALMYIKDNMATQDERS